LNLSVKRKTYCLLALPALGLGIVAGCAESPKPAPAPLPAAPPVASVPVNEYVGSAACGKCHPAEWRRYQETHHARTFRPMTVASLGSSAPAQQPLPGTDCALRIIEGHYALEKSQTGQTRPLEYALGSGKQGMTFIAIEGGDAVFEMRKSYVPRTHRWYTTPGQEENDALPDVIGKRHPGVLSRKCILCHTVTVPLDYLHPEPRFMGVGCESCHGPGSLHIAAVNTRGATDLKMEELKKAGGKRINELCGDCHTTPEEALRVAKPKRLSQRFMPYGLALSRCFRESGDRLTCITCHDPHANASTDNKTYEQICLNCHSQARALALASTSAHAAHLNSARNTVCPVNPRTGCVGCHMPTRHVFPGNPVPIAMADHWIRINR
jgi:hypothetical protein